MEYIDNHPQDGDEKIRKSLYNVPILTHYGSIYELTAGGSGGFPELLGNDDPSFQKP